MPSKTIPSLLAMMPLSLLATGCQSGGIFYEPKAKVTTFSAQDEVVLAAEFAQQPAPERPAATSQPQGATSQPAKKGSYTAPGNQMQQLTFLAIVSASVAAGDVVGDEGREAAENSLGRANFQSSLAPSGQGIAGSTTLIPVGKRGLLQGPPLGGGIAGNIFAPARNALTGPNGRCGELVKAGFFANDTACRNHFGR
jgi:hypothetical protein